MRVKKEKINVITLGCYKNLVDSEQLLRQLEYNHFDILHNSESYEAKTVIINTCGFILDAKKESIDTIFSFVNAKKKGLINHVYVIGCLSERYKKELEKEIPEVDFFLGVNNLSSILQLLGSKLKKELIVERRITTPSHYAYLKIAEGCDRTCSFCSIPFIRGKHQSKSIAQVINEAQFLTSNGVKEIILISQDLSYYGLDKYNKQMLPALVDELSKIKEIEWIRLQYLFPSKFPLELLLIMKNNKKICRYLDIPFQHISDKILKSMKRGISKSETYSLIYKIRQEIPDLALRTTLMVGYPNETNKEFNELIDFVKEIKFERLGIFTYSHEEETDAFKSLQDNVSKEIKKKRVARLMEIQQKISKENNQKIIGNIIKVRIDREEQDFYIGRTEYDSPEIDNEVLIYKRNKLKTGNIYFIKVIDYDNYDLYGYVNKCN